MNYQQSADLFDWLKTGKEPNAVKIDRRLAMKLSLKESVVATNAAAPKLDDVVALDAAAAAVKHFAAAAWSLREALFAGDLESSL